MADISAEVTRIYEQVIDPIAVKYEFERAPHKSERVADPLVLIIGNHSSGKSTFINYLLESSTQNTGVAPTDDCFTIIAHGEPEADLLGQTIVTDEELAYRELNRLGPDFVRHLRMKVRPAAILQRLSLVDTPGMIDSAGGKDRVYDFNAAVRWFAERADVVLFFFDPDKPGTTGETLQVLKVALLDLEHKVHFVLNKVDRFERIEDFARTYGALCWNLAKVIVSKDLPHIDNIYVPRDNAAPIKTELPLASFDAIRDKLIGLVKRAPDLREENIITRLDDHAKRLQLHVTICNEARREYQSHLFRHASLLGLGALAIVVLTWFLRAVEPWYIPAALFLIGLLFLVNFGYYALRMVKNQARSILDSLEKLFEARFRKEIEEDDLDLVSCWKRIQKRTTLVLKRKGLDKVPRLTREDERKLETAIKKEIVKLRGRRLRPEPQPAA